MNQGSDQPSDPARGAAESPDPYKLLGIPRDAGFEAVQAARDARLQERTEDPIARSRIEAAYDAVLMDRLKERQQGRVSSAARSASQREQAVPPPGRPSLPALPSLPQLPGPRSGRSGPSLPALEWASGRERWFPLATHGLLLALLLLLPSAPPELLVALATLATVLNLQRRNGRFLAALGWSFGLLVLGLALGSLLLGVLSTTLPLGLPLGPLQVQSLPAILLLLLGALLIA
ncbi:MAG: CPP1-like family protein [Synechococcaceae cyanobacterium]|nr:CPP1-like family protein [Synechococcaceae cyanobacterium]